MHFFFPFVRCFGRRMNCDHWICSVQNQEVVPDISDWKTYQIVHFLDKLVERPKLSHDTIQALAKKYPKIAESHNAEVSGYVPTCTCI